MVHLVGKEAFKLVERLKYGSISRAMEGMMQKTNKHRKQCKWKNISRQGWQDICTGNFNYESDHSPFPLSNWATALLKEKMTTETDGKKENRKCRHYFERYSQTDQMEAATGKKDIRKQSLLLPEFASACSASVYHSLFLSFHIQVLNFSLLCSLVVLVASVFHFKLKCRDPKLNGSWVKSEETNHSKRGRQKDSWELYNIRQNRCEDSQNVEVFWKQMVVKKNYILGREKREVRRAEVRGTRIKKIGTVTIYGLSHTKSAENSGQ